MHNKYRQLIYNGACGGGGSLRKMDTCPTSLPNKKEPCANNSWPKEAYDKRKSKQMQRDEGLQVQKVGMWGKLGGGIDMTWTIGHSRTI